MKRSAFLAVLALLVIVGGLVLWLWKSRHEVARPAAPAPAAVVSRGAVIAEGTSGAKDAAGALAQICSAAKVSFRSVAVKKHYAIPNEEKSLSKALQTAVDWRLPLVGDISGLDSGQCKDVVLTDAAVYAGKNEAVVEALQELAADDAEARAEAAQKLGLAMDERVEPALVNSLFGDPVPEVRCAAAAALETAKEENSFDALIQALFDPDADVKEHARASLGTVKDIRARDRLKKARAQTSDPEVREMMDQVLEQVYGEPIAVPE